MLGKSKLKPFHFLTTFFVKETWPSHIPFIKKEQGVSFKMAENHLAVYLGGISIVCSFPSGDMY